MSNVGDDVGDDQAVPVLMHDYYSENEDSSSFVPLQPIILQSPKSKARIRQRKKEV